MCTRYGYGIYGFGYGVGKPDPRYTRGKPYMRVDVVVDGVGSDLGRTLS